MPENEKGYYPVVQAAYYGDVDALLMELRSGGDVDELDPSENWRPIHAAIMTGGMDAIKYLLMQRAQVNIPGPRGMTPLHYACRDASGSSAEIAEVLMKARADPGLTDDRGETPVTLAVACDASRALRILRGEPAFEPGLEGDSEVEKAQTAVAKAPTASAEQPQRRMLSSSTPMLRPNLDFCSEEKKPEPEVAVAAAGAPAAGAGGYNSGGNDFRSGSSPIKEPQFGKCVDPEREANMPVEVDPNWGEYREEIRAADASYVAENWDGPSFQTTTIPSL